LEIYGKLKQAKQLPFTQYWLKQVVRFLENYYELMTMNMDKNWDDSYSQSKCQQNSRQNQLLGLFSEQLLKNLKHQLSPTSPDAIAILYLYIISRKIKTVGPLFRTNKI
jgi:hypothetical protein